MPQRSRWVGHAVGQYKILRRLGRGGMATVYEARHRLLGHLVAIKILHSRHRAERALVRRFCNEARVVAAIDHPGVVRYHDIGRTDGGHVYLVMELLAGESLADRLDRCPLSEPQAVTIARRVASALAAAHARGVVHRDIKPENVFLVPDPEVPGGERVKVLDFGVAKVTSRADTSPDVVLGTPAYMAPEQCRPGARVATPIDGRTDIYGLGALVYRMVAGQPVFESPTDIGMMCKQVHDEPPSLRGLGVPVSEAFERMIARCLAKDPDDRYLSMAVLAKVLAGLEASAVERHQKPTALMAAQADPDEIPVYWDTSSDDHGAGEGIELDSLPGYHLPVEPVTDGVGISLHGVPVYPMMEQSPPGGVMADGTLPPGAWEQAMARRVAGPLSGDITILRHGLEGVDLSQVPVHLLDDPGETKRRLWAAIGGFTIGWLVIAMIALLV